MIQEPEPPKELIFSVKASFIDTVDMSDPTCLSVYQLNQNHKEVLIAESGSFQNQQSPYFFKKMGLDYDFKKHQKLFFRVFKLSVTNGAMDFMNYATCQTEVCKILSSINTNGKVILDLIGSEKQGKLGNLQIKLTERVLNEGCFQFNFSS